MIRPFLAAMFVFPSVGVAQDYTLGDLVIAQAVALETPKSAMTGAGYLTITNTGDADDRLVGVAADFPRVMIHQTQTQDGVATMQHQDFVPIPAGATVVFAPGGRHVMFMGLNGDPFEIGEEIPATLTFENAGAVGVIFRVTSRDAMPERAAD